MPVKDYNYATFTLVIVAAIPVRRHPHWCSEKTMPPSEDLARNDNWGMVSTQYALCHKICPTVQSTTLDSRSGNKTRRTSFRRNKPHGMTSFAQPARPNTNKSHGFRRPRSGDELRRVLRERATGVPRPQRGTLDIQNEAATKDRYQGVRLDTSRCCRSR